MTRARMSRITRRIAMIYGAAIVLGVLLRLTFPDANSIVYQTYQDLIPLIIALPAAFLAEAFQRRSSYVQGLRTVWANMVGAISATLTYTELPSPTKEQYADALQRLSASIEEIRGFYANIPAGASTTGWYPFEPVKQIHGVVRGLGYAEAATSELRADAHDQIYQMWRSVRERFLAELDIEVPTYHHAAYARTRET